MGRHSEITIEEGSSNVYVDLGYADAAEMQRKSQLAAEIARAIKARRLTQAGAATLLGIDLFGRTIEASWSPGRRPAETMMGIVIDDELLLATRMSETELKLELAALLYQRERLTLGQAALLAGLSQARLRLALGARGIAPNYGVTEFAEDLKVVRGAV